MWISILVLSVAIGTAVALAWSAAAGCLIAAALVLAGLQAHLRLDKGAMDQALSGACRSQRQVASDLKDGRAAAGTCAGALSCAADALLRNPDTSASTKVVAIGDATSVTRVARHPLLPPGVGGRLIGLPFPGRRRRQPMPSPSAL